MRNVLVVDEHSDDGTLGCGGRLLKYKDQGDAIPWLMRTEMNKNNDLYNTRNSEIEKVSELYSFDSLHKLGLKATQVDEYSMNDLLKKIFTVISQVKLDVILHSDHRKIFEAAYSCTKLFRYPFIKKISMIETLSETEFASSTIEVAFIPNVYVDISTYFKKKLEIMKAYESELAAHSFPRSLHNIFALATIRSATAGCEYVESFVLLKEVR